MVEFPFERLDVYRIALRFAAVAHQIASALPRGFGHIADQLRRASCSVVTNTVEAATEFAPDERARIFRLAFRSAGESIALMGLLIELKQLSARDAEPVRELGSRVMSMLTKLAVANARQKQPRRGRTSS